MRLENLGALLLGELHVRVELAAAILTALVLACIIFAAVLAGAICHSILYDVIFISYFVRNQHP